MSLLSDRTIKYLIQTGDLVIEPFHEGLTEKGVLSYGLGSCGYDLRLGRRFKVFTNTRCTVVDPKNFDSASFVDIEADVCLIPPTSFALAEAFEYIKLPRNVLGLLTTKSSYARCGISFPCTVVEPSWDGHLTFEIANNSPLPAKVYAMEGAIQLLLFRADEEPMVSYAERKGKYQSQTGLTLPFVRS